MLNKRVLTWEFMYGTAGILANTQEMDQGLLELKA